MMAHRPHRTLGRLLVALVCAVLLVTLRPSAALAQTSADGSWEFDLASDGSAHITAYKGPSTDTLDIPNSIDGYTVTGIGDYAFANDAELTSIYLPPTISSLGTGAFKDCTNLTHAELYAIEGLQNISYSCFEGCTALTSVIIPACVRDIENSAFRGCTSLASVTFQDPSCTSVIGTYAFEGCTALTTIDLPPNLDLILEGAFQNCTSLKRYTYELGTNLRQICDDAFSGCSSLEVGELPPSVKTIGIEIFAYCTSMHTFVFGSDPYALQDFGEYEGKHYELLGADPVVNLVYTPYSESSSFVPGDWNLPDSASVVTYKDLGDGTVQITGCILAPSFSSYEVPAKIIGKPVTRLSPAGAHDMSRITSLTFEEGSHVEVIDNGFFRELMGLTSLTLPPSLTTLGEEAFFGCGCLTSITFTGSKLKTIGKCCFDFCERVTELHLPEGLTTIADGAFANCIDLKRLYLPSTITELGILFDACGRGGPYTMPKPELISMPDAPTPIAVDADMFFFCWDASACTLEVTFGSWSDVYLADQLISKASDLTLGYRPIDLNDETISFEAAPTYFSGRGSSAFNAYASFAITRWLRTSDYGSDYTLHPLQGYNYTKACVTAVELEGTGERLSGSRVVEYTILPYSIKDAEWHQTWGQSADPTFEWDDDPWEPMGTLLDLLITFPPAPGETWNHYGYLPDGCCRYRVEYQDNEDAGTATVLIYGMDDYCGTCTLSFVITKRDLSEATVEVEGQLYTGSAVTPKPTSVTILKRDGESTLGLKEGMDYELSYRDNVGPGEATMVLTAIEGSNLTGSVEVPFLIVKEEQEEPEPEPEPKPEPEPEPEPKPEPKPEPDPQPEPKPKLHVLPATSDTTMLALPLAAAGVALVVLGTLGVMSTKTRKHAS